MYVYIESSPAKGNPAVVEILILPPLGDLQ
jgi:hypothetical protein